jgi:hypothetical protein
MIFLKVLQERLFKVFQGDAFFRTAAQNLNPMGLRSTRRGKNFHINSEQSHSCGKLKDAPFRPT